MTFCKNCGAQIEEDKNFCSSCGQPVLTATPPQPQQPYQPPPYQQQPQGNKGPLFGGDAVAAHKSSLGMDANIAVLLMYVAMVVVSWIPYLGWVAWAAPLVFFLMEKESGFVKFHAAQALGIGIVRAAFAIVFQIFIWILTPKVTYDDIYYGFNRLLGRGLGISLLTTIAIIIGVAITLVEVYVIYTAYNWKQVELPIIGPVAKKASQK